MNAIGSRSIRFISQADELSVLINEKANELFNKLRTVKVQELQMDEFGKYYFLKHHAGRRLYFSLESSADIIYQCLQKKKTHLNETTFVDYGAGLGTLFLLAGMIGFKQVIYNDLLQSWTDNAKALCRNLGIDIPLYITGDIDELLQQAKQHGTGIDIIASRNVIEHIYDLELFYKKIAGAYPAALIFSTTTANYHNPAMRVKHHVYHKKLDRELYQPQRAALVKEKRPAVTAAEFTALVKATRGKAYEDFDMAVDNFFAQRPIPPVPYLGSNTCDSHTGVWAEHLLPKQAYREIFEAAGYRMAYLPGFWDTHYRYGLVNFFTRFFNLCAKGLGKKGYWLSPFVKIIAYRD